MEISEERMRNIMHEESGKRKLFARWMPHLLNAFQKQMLKFIRRNLWTYSRGIRPILSPWMRHESITKYQISNNSRSSGWKPVVLCQKAKSIASARKNASAFVIKTGNTTQWQADLVPKEMAASDMRNRHHVQLLLTWCTNAAHPVNITLTLLTSWMSKFTRRGTPPLPVPSPNEKGGGGAVTSSLKTWAQLARLRVPYDVGKSGSTTEECNVRTVAVDQGTQGTRQNSCLSTRFDVSTIQREIGTQVSKMTINRRLRARNLRARRPLRCLPLTPVHRQIRLQWCRERSTWNCADWGRIVFSNESRFLLCPDDRRKRVWRRPWKRVGPGLTFELHIGPQQVVMGWGAISFDSRNPLVVFPDTLTAQLYIDDILRPVSLPFLSHHPGLTFQQDNARPHTARVTVDYLQSC
ncbi:hypothetical protein LAZ67_1003709 [Cordylochernes scorpioides]|uniref:Transposase Tc1-like domain-containing protein n=1 Tax=Cordylochernes scorpioides TaxID=51811 RepID=A0ABY6JX73_9ARAC|nr:hypothetical protein LAZ67_1003709 [Cordylochernes scorpioides]